ncbi:MAG TPA: alpha/beta hydrolase [Actinomycetales bacterium]|nr:alpha/beta hydrolase [Actinomycetales bacterium]
MRPVLVDATRLDELARRLVALEGRARESTVDLEAAASAVAARALPVEAGLTTRTVGWALTLREQLLRRLLAFAAVVVVVARGYRETERQVCAELARLLTPPGQPTGGDVAPGLVSELSPWGTGAWLGSGGSAVAHPAARAGTVDASWWAPVEQTLGGLRPDLLEVLLVGTPALARLVADAPAPADGTPGAALATTLRRAERLQPSDAAALVAGHLATLAPDVRRRLALLQPALMTAAAAAPVADRVAASRVLVAADLARLQGRRSSASPSEAARLDRRAAWEHRLLDEKVVLRHPDGTETRHPHQLLQFDPSGDGRIVEVLGDLDRAEHLAVFVPGTGSDLDRYPGTFARMKPFAAASPDLAVVVWQDADHPDQPLDDGLPTLRDVVRSVGHEDPVTGGRDWLREHVLAAGLRDAADVAGPALARDVAGLRTAAPGPTADLTVLGHSYGGSVVGAAELHGLVADRVVHVASAGAYVDDVTRYPPSARRTQRFSMTAYDDPIRLSQGHGLSDGGYRLRQLVPSVLDPLTIGAPVVGRELGPSSQIGHGLDPDLLPGVVRLDTGVHDDGTLVSGHSGMFTSHSTAWRNLLAVMTKGKVEVLEPQRWSSHLEPLQLPTVLQTPGHPSVPGHLPRYVVDRSPYGDPHYQPPVLDLAKGETP